MKNKEIYLIPCTENLKRHKLKIAVIFPDSYYTGMSNLGFHRLLQILYRRNQFFVERCFYQDDQIQLTNLKSIDKLKEFDCLLFSVSFVENLKNVYTILNRLQLSPGSSGPVIIAGGMAVSINPYKIKDYTDFIFQGEVDDCLDMMLHVWDSLFKKLQVFFGVGGIKINSGNYLRTAAVHL